MSDESASRSSHSRRVRPVPFVDSSAETSMWSRTLPWVLVSAFVPLLGLLIIARFDLSGGLTNPPGADLSRRAVFSLAAALQLYGAGLVGYGIGAARRRNFSRSRAKRAMQKVAMRKRYAIILATGIVVVLVAGGVEYMTLIDRVP